MDGLPFGEIAEEREAQAQHGFSDQKSIKRISKHHMYSLLLLTELTQKVTITLNIFLVFLVSKYQSFSSYPIDFVCLRVPGATERISCCPSETRASARGQDGAVRWAHYG